jgi:hypothetical protein
MALRFVDDTHDQRESNILMYDDAGVDVHDRHIAPCVDTGDLLSTLLVISTPWELYKATLSPLRSRKLLTTHLLRGRPLIVLSWHKIGDLVVGEDTERYLLLTRSHFESLTVPLLFTRAPSCL